MSEPNTHLLHLDHDEAIQYLTSHGTLAGPAARIVEELRQGKIPNLIVSSPVVGPPYEMVLWKSGSGATSDLAFLVTEYYLFYTVVYVMATTKQKAIDLAWTWYKASDGAKVLYNASYEPSLLVKVADAGYKVYKVTMSVSRVKGQRMDINYEAEIYS